MSTAGTDPPPATVGYPQSHATTRSIAEELAGVRASAGACTSFYLDTIEEMSNTEIAGWVLTQGENHHQGIARTHRTSDGSITWFLAHSGMADKHGTITQYRYRDPTEGEHVLQGSPLWVAPMVGAPLELGHHPSDITFLPDVGNADAGYLFATVEDDDLRRVVIYRWTSGQPLQEHDVVIPPADDLAGSGPNFVFVDRVDDRYCLGIASNNWQTCFVYRAQAAQLFPSSSAGALDAQAFFLDPIAARVPFLVTGSPCQAKLVRDVSGAWFLLAFRCSDPGSETDEDWIDAYPVSVNPQLSLASAPAVRVHIAFNPGRTSFASTGTCYVEPAGRLLVSSSYRWAADEGPGDSSFVSRVDECPSTAPPPPGATPGSGPVGTDRPPHHPD